MPSSRTLLAVDLSYQTYRAASAHQKLTSQDGEFTGGLYGFLVTLAKIIRDTEATRVVVTADRKPYLRSGIYPQYKQIRKSASDPELKAKVEVSKPQIVAALETIGIPVVGIEGFESDDLIGHYARQYRHRFDTIYAASNDSDLFQLLDPRGRFRIYRKDESDVWSHDAVLKHYGITPEQYILATALMGTHNDVEGIPRVGVKTAVAAVTSPGKMRQYLEQHGELIDRNMRLIRLPFEGFPAQTPLPACGTFQHRALYRFCSKYDISVTKSMLDAFEQVCP
jgi:DNA polymerase-1